MFGEARLEDLESQVSDASIVPREPVKTSPDPAIWPEDSMARFAAFRQQIERPAIESKTTSGRQPVGVPVKIFRDQPVRPALFFPCRPLRFST
jgi:hypothetical protein